MPMATIRKVGGESDLYHIHFLDASHGHPDQGLPGGGHVGNRPPGSGGGGHPDQGLPGHGHHPDQDLPSGGRPDQGLPGGGHVGNRPPGTEHPGNRPPGSGSGGIPDHDLPDRPPPQVAPGQTLVLVRSPDGKWKYATIDANQPQPKPVPEQGQQGQTAGVGQPRQGGQQAPPRP